MRLSLAKHENPLQCHSLWSNSSIHRWLAVISMTNVNLSCHGTSRRGALHWYEAQVRRAVHHLLGWNTRFGGSHVSVRWLFPAHRVSLKSFHAPRRSTTPNPRRRTRSGHHAYFCPPLPHSPPRMAYSFARCFELPKPKLQLRMLLQTLLCISIIWGSCVTAAKATLNFTKL